MLVSHKAHQHSSCSQVIENHWSGSEVQSRTSLSKNSLGLINGHKLVATMTIWLDRWPQKPGPQTIYAAENTQVIIGPFYMSLMRGAPRVHENVTPP
ncbi:hypothetical protein FOBRF1_012523 [Fusarium oxysporum]